MPIYFPYYIVCNWFLFFVLIYYLNSYLVLFHIVNCFIDKIIKSLHLKKDLIKLLIQVFCFEEIVFYGHTNIILFAFQIVDVGVIFRKRSEEHTSELQSPDHL